MAGTNQETNDTEQQRSIEIPTISLPKGGGAVSGIQEKFSVSPASGTGSMTIPIATSPGRSNFGPQLALNYDSGSGNGVFGFGWNLAIPGISRKTDKGLPGYRDEMDSDTFVLAGVEDLVPTLLQAGESWLPEKVPNRSIGTERYQIKRYRPRIEGSFSQIECWTNLNSQECHWRTISKENITNVYGRTNQSRIQDPEVDGTQPPRIFSWLICESYDDKGNAIYYEYQRENSDNVNTSQVHERNRSEVKRSANRYLKRIKYGNTSPVVVGPDMPREFREDLSARSDWLFEIVFDYGENHLTSLPGSDDHTRVTAQSNVTENWLTRQDPFSRYRPGFEVRTYRLCHKILMFHHFPDELAVQDYLVRSTEFQYSESPSVSFITSVSQSAYKLTEENTYVKRSIPPVEFEYSKATLHQEIQTIDEASLENSPQGLDGTNYRWADVDGEGISGILAEQNGTWYYKRNLSPLTFANTDTATETISQTSAKFAPLETLSTNPSVQGLSQGRFQLLDLSGNGQLDVATFEGPSPGYFERDTANDWHSFKPFQSLPNVNWRDPNMKFIDLTGDGHADILITEDEVFSWYQSLAELGFKSGEKVRQALDEEQGPKVVFADGTQSIYLADFSGDGLTDIVRIRNGKICYWPNLGYGRFAAQVTMDNSPLFDTSDQFDHRRIRLADIDGNGVADILYLKSKSIDIYTNHLGNAWGDVSSLQSFPRIDNLTAVNVLDLLGIGTACVVWSSPLPKDSDNQLQYIDLMGGQKPHLLVRSKNNLGASTEIQYAPSTKFYLADKYAGTPWITKIPFPVHVVEKVIAKDKWRKTHFVTSYSYHHGYFDGREREFRGFGRVEQTDVESFGEFSAGNIESPYITNDKTFYQPPVKTVSWFHTGAAVDREHILNQYQQEYFPQWYAREHSTSTELLGDFQEKIIPEPDLKSSDLNAAEWRQAMRACKGMLLRQEVYELEVSDEMTLAETPLRPTKLFSCGYHNCQIRQVQPQLDNRHAVFLVTESEAIEYHYELALGEETLVPDPRIAHTLNLVTDELGNVLQSVAVVYPRRARYQDPTLPPGAVDKIAQVQSELHITYAENIFTEDIIENDQHRLRVPCEVANYELTGVTSSSDYFDIEALRALNLSTATTIPYHQVANKTDLQKRLVELQRLLYFDNDLKNPLPLGRLNALGLPFESYYLALTDELLTTVLASKLTAAVRADLNDADLSGYLNGEELDRRFPTEVNRGQYWIRSGIAGFVDEAAQHFYLPERYLDPFGNETRVDYDGSYDLFIQSSRDPEGNTNQITHFDYRLLVPIEMQDSNHNLTEVAYDILGMPTATAVKGKGTEGDNLGLSEELLNPGFSTRSAFFTDAFEASEARRLLATASTRSLYHFGEARAADGTLQYAVLPPSVASIVREKHVAKLEPDEESPIQVAFAYSDGGGNLLVTKTQAEPEPVIAADSGTPTEEDRPLRWIASGKTILNNKGKAVKQYEPYFSVDNFGEPNHRFEEPREVGVTPLMYYDAAGRLVRTEMPDGNISRVEFNPWQVTTYDPNDTLREMGNRWFAEHNASSASAEENRAARLSAEHAETPAMVFLDSLGREVIGVAHNKYVVNRGRSDETLIDEKYVTFTKLDTEGKALWIRDARNNLVMQYVFPVKPTRALEEDDPLNPESMPETSVPCYDIAGNLLYQSSMDAGERWMLSDASGQAMYAWDSNERVQDDGSLTATEQRIYRTTYDGLRRPLKQMLDTGSGEQVIEKFVYGESHVDGFTRNLRGQLYQHYDPSGLVTNERIDFKGNSLHISRRLVSDYTLAVVHWPDESPDAGLETETFHQVTEYDALNRMSRLYNWHRGEGSRVAVYEPIYNERGLLFAEDLVVGATKIPTGYVERHPLPGGVSRPPTETRKAERTAAIVLIDYDAKGQRQSISYGNRTRTDYTYDPFTSRLMQLKTRRESGGAFLQNLNYTYDPVGNITEIRDFAQQTFFFRQTEIQPHCSYQYDSLYRLITADGREHATQNNMQPDNRKFEAVEGIPFANSPEALQNYTENYHYDSVGNFLTMSHTGHTSLRWKRCYQYAENSNRLLATGKPGDLANPEDNCPRHYVDTPTLSQHYEYDSHGNMLNLQRNIEEFRLRWDYRDMIHSVNLGGGGNAWYNYDVQKERTRKRIESIGSRVEERLYLGGLEIYRRWDTGTLVEEIETLHLFDGDQRLLIVEDVLETDNRDLDVATLYRYQYSNHLGSVALECDASDAVNVISYEEYHPYGTTAYQAKSSAINATTKRYLYTGMEKDEETGLSYHLARYYLPWLGRWGSADPIGIEDDMNLYSYVSGRVLNAIDLTGTQSRIDGGVSPTSRPSSRSRRRSSFPRRSSRTERWREQPLLYRQIVMNQFGGIVLPGDLNYPQANGAYAYALIRNREAEARAREAQYIERVLASIERETERITQSFTLEVDSVGGSDRFGGGEVSITGGIRLSVVRIEEDGQEGERLGYLYPASPTNLEPGRYALRVDASARFEHQSRADYVQGNIQRELEIEISQEGVIRLLTSGRTDVGDAQFLEESTSTESSNISMPEVAPILISDLEVEVDTYGIRITPRIVASQEAAGFSLSLSAGLSAAPEGVGPDFRLETTVTTGAPIQLGQSPSERLRFELRGMSSH